MGMYDSSLTWAINPVHSHHGEQVTYVKWIKICNIIIIIIIIQKEALFKVFF